MGVPVVLTGPQNYVSLAAETLDSARLSSLLALGGQPVLTITQRRATTLKARAYDGDVARIELPADASLLWVQSIADPADDLRSPMKGPADFQPATEMPQRTRAAIALTKAARLLPSALVLTVANGANFAARHGLSTVPLQEASAHLNATSPLHPVVHARLPMDVSEAGRLHIFRPEDGAEEHYAHRNRAPRSQQTCAGATAFCVFHRGCDGQPQMRLRTPNCAPRWRKWGTRGTGVLLYMNQEGRGIGLANKMRAYSLQDQGFDTVEANHRLGFEDDERDFKLGADILKSMGFSSVRLLTNNPAKVDMMNKCGVAVAERVALKVGENRHNADYLATKAHKSGHLL